MLSKEKNVLECIYEMEKLRGEKMNYAYQSDLLTCKKGLVVRPFLWCGLSTDHLEEHSFDRRRNWREGTNVCM